MKRFFIVTNRTKDEDGRITEQVVQYLTARQAVCTVSGQEQAEVPEGTECILVLGGDGTLIRAVSTLASYEVPFIGVNLGHLGYLTEADQNGLWDTLDALLTNRYQIESRMMLYGEVIRGGAQIDAHYALNDVVLSRYGRLQVIHFALSVDETYLNTYHADGMIIATPTGSTAYNLSAGGPICFPQAELFVVTPICAHTMNTRSIVLPSDVVVELEVLDEPEAEMAPTVVYDGCHWLPLQKHDRIRVRRLERRCQLIKLNNVTFVEMLRDKMKSI